MRSQKEKKSIVKSFKVSEEQLNYIEDKASSKGMNFSQYVLDCALHTQNTITPQMLCQWENILNSIKNKYDTKDDVLYNNIRKEINKLWDLLK
ncbi:MAG: plasmid mobilization protein [Bacilli bacterium]